MASDLQFKVTCEVTRVEFLHYNIKYLCAKSDFYDKTNY